MLDGERPAECQYCWNVEDLDGYKNKEFFSDRIIKSASDWSLSKLKEVTEHPIANINPSYVEVSFSNLCNFKCSYCSPVYSSRWTEEVENNGPYPTSNKFNNLEYYRDERVNEMPIHHKEHNPYVEAFWEWWPDLVEDLKVFRITGGEPLLHNDTFKILDYLYDNPKPHLSFSVNTNACVPDGKIDLFISKLQTLIAENKIGDTQIFTSVDAHGTQAEYGRCGLDYDKWLANINKFLTELPKTRITIMCTTNILSITTYDKLLKDVLDIKRKYYNADLRRLPISLDVAILRHPQHQCVSILTDEYKTYMDSSLDFMNANKNTLEVPGFHDYEITRLARFIEFMKSPPNENENLDIPRMRRDFYKFMDEHDNRRRTNFLKTFPELENFYNACKDA